MTDTQLTIVLGFLGGTVTTVLGTMTVFVKMHYDSKEAQRFRERQDLAIQEQAKAIQQNTEISAETNRTVATVQKQTNRGLGVALRTTAVALRTLAVSTDDPGHAARADVAEKAADEHDAQAKLADEDVSRRADAVAVAAVEAKKPWPLPTGPADPGPAGGVTLNRQAAKIAADVQVIKETLADAAPAPTAERK